MMVIKILSLLSYLSFLNDEMNLENLFCHTGMSFILTFRKLQPIPVVAGSRLWISGRD